MRDELIRAVLKYQGVSLIHNDLANAANHLKDRIVAAETSGERDGIGLDMMAAVVMTSFTFEAYLNFIGEKVVADFDPWMSAPRKRARVMRELGIEWRSEQRPFSSIEELISIRNDLAHGKPLQIDKEWEAEGTHAELENQLGRFHTGPIARIGTDLVCRGFEDVQELWRMMLEAADLEYFETLSGGMSSMSFIGYAKGTAASND